MTPRRAVVGWRIAWTILSLVCVEIVVFGAALSPVVLAWQWLTLATASNPPLRWALFSAALAPSYLLFALFLIVLSPLAARALGWRTPDSADMPIAGMGWPLLRWARYGAANHMVRVCAGPVFRGTPVWTMHLRLGGARLGRRVYVNSLAINDYNLLECGDDVVIGDAVHLSGHTVEAGVVKTARVRLGSNVTIGLGSVIEIGVEVGSNSLVGALSFVPKYTNLPGGVVYAGVPAVPLK